MSTSIKITASMAHYGGDEGIQESIYIAVDMVDVSRAIEIKKDLEAFMEIIKNRYFVPKVVKEIVTKTSL